MSFVGTRPEVTKYVQKYTKEMRARSIEGRTDGLNERYADKDYRIIEILVIYQ